MSASQNARENRRKKRLRPINRQLILSDKKLKGCQLCGRKTLSPEELHYHHRNWRSKVRKVSHRTAAATATLIEEIQRCTLVCARSHRYFHAHGVLKPCSEAFKPEAGANL